MAGATISFKNNFSGLDIGKVESFIAKSKTPIQNVTAYDVLGNIDYSEVAANVVDVLAENKETLIDKGINTTMWAATKSFVTTNLEKNLYNILGKVTGSSCSSSFGSAIVSATLEGLYKGGLKTISTGGSITVSKFVSTFSSGFTKSLSKTTVFDPFSKTLTKIIKNKGTDMIDDFMTAYLGKGGFKELLEKIGQEGVKQQYPNLIFKLNLSDFVNVASKIGLSVGVEYAASMTANLVSAWIDPDKEVNLKNMKPGQTLLRSSTKMIFTTAGQFLLGKKGKLIGTVVGATIAEFQVAGFTEMDENGKEVVNEKWCAIAGGAEIAGAVVGAAAVTFLVSNPAGWIVCVGLLVGAAVGYSITLLAYHWDDVCNWVSETWDSTIKLVGNTIDYFEDKIEDGVEYIENKVEEVKDWVEAKVQANPVTNFLVGWAF